MTGPQDLVTIIFPSGPPKKEQLEKAVQVISQEVHQLSCPLLEQPSRWDYQPNYLCGSDIQRTQEVLSSWEDPSQTVVWCGRGGYGATRLLKLLAKQTLMRKLPPSSFLGYSDITALFALVKVQKLPISCIHCPVALELPHHPHPQLVLQSLKGVRTALPVGSPAPQGFKGTIWGGNLAVLASLCGTPWLPAINNQAIFIEDVDEQPYRLDRFITQLFDSNFFSHCSGVFLGQFTRCGPNDSGLQTIVERLKELQIPILGSLPVGHEAYHIPLFLDRIYYLDLERSELRPLEY